MSSTLPKSVQAQMASGISQERLKEIKNFVLKNKNLPDDFLRLNNDAGPILRSHRDIVPNQATTHSMNDNNTNRPFVDIIEISAVEAQLVKNYGLLKMDLYCKIRVGHLVCSTLTCTSGAKNPKWGELIHFNLEPGIDSFHLEIYAVRQFSSDELIAWLYAPIPGEIYQGITVERWFPLTGKLGPNKEGSILLVLSHKRVSSRQHPQPVHLYLPNHSLQGPMFTHANPIDQTPSHIAPMPGLPPPQPVSSPVELPTESVQPIHQHIPQPIVPAPVSDDDINQLSDMFPSMSRSVIKSILENHNSDKEAAISYLLSLT